MTSRDVVTVTGAAARSYLHGQLAQDVAGLAVGDSRWALVLEPTGKVAALVRVRCIDDERFELDVEPRFGAALEARVNRFRIRVAVSTELATDVAVDPGTLVGWWGSGLDDRRWSADVGGDTAGDGDLEARRVAAGWPAMGAEIIEGDTIPAETGVLDVAVRFGKGCYPGQELVERMHARTASAPYRLVRLDVSPGQVAGDPVHDGDDVEVGVITSVAAPFALARVKRSATIGTPVGPSS